MGYIKKVIALAIALPFVATFLLYRLDPKLLQPGSSSFILSFLPMFGGPEQAVPALNQSDSPSQVLNLIWSTFSIKDSLLAGKRGVRDPMMPLVSTGHTVQADLRRQAQKIEPPRFPFARRDMGAIIWNERNPIVFLKGKRQQVGDVINEARITAITKTSVSFLWRDNTYVLERSSPTLNIE